jgi:hypothetical protein
MSSPQTPVDNSPLLCKHGNVKPSCSDPSKRVKQISKKAWDFLVAKYGLSAPLQSLKPCPECLEIEQQFESRRTEEWKKICDLVRESVKENTPNSATYLLSSRWFNAWKEFRDGNQKKKRTIFTFLFLSMRLTVLSFFFFSSTKKKV